jgi:sporulation protein YlmC with PRC-barrel domain
MHQAAPLSATIENNIREISINNTCFEGKDMENANDVLIGKTVLNAKGVIIGRIMESIKDGISGEITSVLIQPSKEVNLQKYTLTNRGEIIFPFSSLSSVKDIIVIEEPL